MADTNNPWSADGWNVTAQMAYLRANGQARADARARDAGTTVGGRRPKSAGAVQSGDGGGTTKYIILKKFFQIPNAPSAFFSVAEIHPAIGVSMAAFVTRELILPPAAPAIGFNSAAVVTLEKDIAASPAMGFNVAAVVDRFFQPTVNNAVGASMAAAIQRSTNPNVLPGLGITEAVVLTTFVSGLPASSAALGISQATTITFEKDLAAAPALGVAQATTLTREFDAAAAPALGIVQAVTLQLTSNFAVAPALGVTMGANFNLEFQLAAGAGMGLTTSAALYAQGQPTFVSAGAVVHATSTSASVPAPASGIAAGDLLLVVVQWNATNATMTSPSGWTQENPVNGALIAAGKSNYAWKIASGTENGTSFTFNGWASGEYTARLFVYRHVDQTCPIMQVYSAASSLGTYMARAEDVRSVQCLTQFSGGTFPTNANYTIEAVSTTLQAMYDTNTVYASGSTVPALTDGNSVVALLTEITPSKNVQARLYQAASLTPGTASFTATAQPIGPATSTRTVFVALGLATVANVTSMTIGGVTATRIDENVYTAQSLALSLWAANVPTGTTANVDVTCNASIAKATMLVYAAAQAINFTPSFSSSISYPANNTVTNFTYTAPQSGSCVLVFENAGSGSQNFAPTGQIWSDGTFLGNVNVEMSAGHCIAPAASQTVSFGAINQFKIRACYVFSPAP